MRLHPAHGEERARPDDLHVDVPLVHVPGVRERRLVEVVHADPGGPAFSCPIGDAIGVFDPIISIRNELAPNGTDTWPCTSSTGRLWYTR